MIADVLRPCLGHKVRYKRAYEAFLGNLPAEQQLLWSRPLFTELLRHFGYQTGVGNSNTTYVINATDDSRAMPTTALVIVGKTRRIKRGLK